MCLKHHTEDSYLSGSSCEVLQEFKHVQMLTVTFYLEGKDLPRNVSFLLPVPVAIWTYAWLYYTLETKEEECLKPSLRGKWDKAGIDMARESTVTSLGSHGLLAPLCSNAPSKVCNLKRCCRYYD